MCAPGSSMTVESRWAASHCAASYLQVACSRDIAVVGARCDRAGYSCCCELVGCGLVGDEGSHLDSEQHLGVAEQPFAQLWVERLVDVIAGHPAQVQLHPRGRATRGHPSSTCALRAARTVPMSGTPDGNTGSWKIAPRGTCGWRGQGSARMPAAALVRELAPAIVRDDRVGVRDDVGDRCPMPRIAGGSRRQTAQLARGPACRSRSGRHSPLSSSQIFLRPPACCRVTPRCDCIS
jgi:hypothetical protein